MVVFLPVYLSEDTMHASIYGRVLFRNHHPAKDVEVRVFDRDDPGKIDDDLTIRPGKTDGSGHFKVTYNPALFRDTITNTVTGRQSADYQDRYIPYARFSYQHDGQQRFYTSPVLTFRREYILPELKPLHIDPVNHGFAFRNSFPGYALPFRLPNFPGIREVDSIHGLCGGISAAIYDFYLCGRSVPKTDKVPEKGTSLYRYLYKRQMQTYGMIGETVMKFGEWMLLPDDGPNSIKTRTYKSLQSIKSELDEGNAVLLGLVYVDWRNGFQIWNNHQVLAYRYSEIDGTGKTSLFIADPNYPRKANVRIESQVDDNSPLGVTSAQWVDHEKVKDVRGYFSIPYSPVTPPISLST
jgi:hypothetical protein